MQFNVPQFIDVEDKLIGPLGIKQFLYLVGGAIVLFLLWLLLEFYVFIVFAIPVLVLAVALAFFKVNGRPLINYFGSLLKFFTKPKLYLWKKQEKE